MYKAVAGMAGVPPVCHTRNVLVGNPGVDFPLPTRGGGWPKAGRGRRIIEKQILRFAQNDGRVDNSVYLYPPLKIRGGHGGRYDKAE